MAGLEPSKQGNPAAKEQLLFSIQSLFENADYSDLIVSCQNTEIKVHKAIVCSRSGFFDRACRKNAWKEGAEGIVYLKSDDDYPVPLDDPELINLMFKYMYGIFFFEGPKLATNLNDDDIWTNYGRQGANRSSKRFAEAVSRYDDDMKAVKASLSAADLIQIVKLYILVDYFDVPDMKLTIEQDMCKALPYFWNGPEFIEILELLRNFHFDETNQVRNVVIDIISNNPSLLDNAKIETILYQNPSLTVALLKHAYRKSKTVLTPMPNIICEPLIKPGNFQE